MGLGLYIHIPFCQKKCHYCDFISAPPTDEEQIKKYINSLLEEIAIYRQVILPKSVQKIDTIYLGGGTPTSIKTEYLEAILEKCHQSFSLAKEAEITIEANPGTINRGKLKALKGQGVNRISLGVQSFNNHRLKEMGRIHTFEEAEAGILEAKNLGFNNISLDLIYGLPEQSYSEWQKTLQKAVVLPITHISVYGLKIEEATFWGQMEQGGKLDLPSEDNQLKMREWTNEFLAEKGYRQYEISNYAKAGYESKHNLKYWHNENFLGMGLGASSYLWGRRYKNTDNLHKYIQLLTQNELAIEEEELLSHKETIGDTVFLALRLSQGLHKEKFRKKFGLDIWTIFPQELTYLIDLKVLAENQNYIFLTKKGIPVANQIFTYFI